MRKLRLKESESRNHFSVLETSSPKRIINSKQKLTIRSIQLNMKAFAKAMNEKWDPSRSRNVGMVKLAPTKRRRKNLQKFGEERILKRSHKRARRLTPCQLSVGRRESCMQSEIWKGNSFRSSFLSVSLFLFSSLSFLCVSLPSLPTWPFLGRIYSFWNLSVHEMKRKFYFNTGGIMSARLWSISG